MRILGYPPDWMKRAQLTSLDVAGQFDQSISKLKNLEEGEVQNELKYNKDSLIQFPGFNCPNPEGVKDVRSIFILNQFIDFFCSTGAGLDHSRYASISRKSRAQSSDKKNGFFRAYSL